ncbi:MAG: hypothetical protein ACLS9K_09730 [Lachnospira eligens]
MLRKSRQKVLMHLSINFPYIAIIRNNIVEYNINTFENIMTSGNGFHIKTDMCTDIAVITLFPGMNYNIFDYLNSSCRGVILRFWYWMNAR